MDIDDIILLAAASRAHRRRPAQPPVPFAATRRPIEEWLDSPTLLFNATGLRLITIQRLCAWLRDHAHIENPRSKISLEEKVLIFLHICRKGAGFRETQIAFNHSTDTISRSFHVILDALVQLHREVVRQPESQENSLSRYFARLLSPARATPRPALATPPKLWALHWARRLNFRGRYPRMRPNCL